MSKIVFDHIAIAVERITDAPDTLVGVLGGTPAYGAPTSEYTFGQWRFAGGGRIEILEPAGADGFLSRFLVQRGPGIHHVTFKVPDIHEARERAEAHGYDIVGFDDSEPEWKTFFLHPRQALGIVVQLAQASGHGPRGWTPPPSPTNPPPAVRLVGLRMRARSRERAETQWERLLLGERTERDGNELIYRWPSSPLRIAIDVDAECEEGPLAVEYASDRHVALAEAPVRRLGARFTRVSDGLV
jgi:catechol 2,3-dioxygenase-like lactoylglutathione lyase family enzyme